MPVLVPLVLRMGGSLLAELMDPVDGAVAALPCGPSAPASDSQSCGAEWAGPPEFRGLVSPIY